jgi:hypothetical protein
MAKLNTRLSLHTNYYQNSLYLVPIVDHGKYGFLIEKEISPQYQK